MNTQELIDALNEQWEKKIVTIKTEIKAEINSCKDNESDDTWYCAMDKALEIINKHMGDKNE